jgi:hypothetical protein
MSVRSDGVGGVVDAGVKVERNAVDEAQPLLLEEANRVPQLSVGRDLHADAHQRVCGFDAELLAQSHREQADAVMLGAAAEKDAAVTAIIDILGLGEAEKLGVEALGGIDIGNEQLDRADPGDLERSLQHHAAHAIVVRQVLGGTEPGVEVDPAALRNS